MVLCSLGLTFDLERKVDRDVDVKYACRDQSGRESEVFRDRDTQFPSRKSISEDSTKKSSLA